MFAVKKLLYLFALGAQLNTDFMNFDPNQSFLKLRILWLVVALITLSAIFIALLIAYFSDLRLRLDYVGFNNFLTYFKVPLSLCALNIPIVALLAANHRSEQTKEQIKIATLQNSFSNHYKHVEEFEKYYNSHSNTKIIKPTNIRKMHSTVFPNSYSGDYQINLKLIESLESICVDIIKKLNTFNKPEYFARQVVADLERQIRVAENKLFLKYNITSGSVFEYDGIKIILTSDNLKGYLDLLKQRINIIALIFQFDHGFVEFDSIYQLKNLKLEQVPSISFSTQQNESPLFSVI